MTDPKPVDLRDRPQPGELNPQAEKEMLGRQGNQKEMGIDPDAVLAAMVAHALGADRLRAKEFIGVVLRTDIPVKAITPDLGPYYKVYKEIEQRELQKDPENGTQTAVDAARKSLFMMKVRVPVLDSMIPDPPVYDIDKILSTKLHDGSGGASLTPEDSFSIKCISMHSTFVGKRGGFLGMGENIPPVHSYVRVSYDDVANLAGPQYLGEVELQSPAPEGGGAVGWLMNQLPGGSGAGGCNGGLGALPGKAKEIATKGKDTVISVISGKGIPESKKKRIEREIKESQEERERIIASWDTKEETEEERITVAALSRVIRGLEAELKAAAPAPSGTDSGERRQDPTLPPASPAGTCQSGYIGSNGQPGPPGTNTYLPPQSIKPPNSDPGAVVKETAQLLGIPEAVVMAFRSVESGGSASAVRFEPHHFVGRYRPDLAGVVPWTESRSKRTTVSYTGRETNAAAFAHAFSYDPMAAVASTSFGLFQVMGYQFFSVEAMKAMGAAADTAWAKVGGKVPGHVGWNGKTRYKQKKTIARFVSGRMGNPVFGFTSGQQARSAFDSDPTGTSWKLLKVWVNAAGPKFVQACNTPNFNEMARMYNGPGKVARYGPKLSKAYARHTATT